MPRPGSRRGAALVLGVVAALCGAPAASAQNPVTLVSVAGYGNFHAAGVLATVTGDDNRNAVAGLEWRRQGDAAFQTGHPLARIDATHFAGSLFWLTAGTAYEVRVSLSDPEGAAGSPGTASFATRADTLPEPTLRTLYVATTGDDTNPGTEPAPFRTIQHAATVSQPGDLILIQPGTYRETVTVTASGTASQPIVFRGNSSGVILDGADPTIDAGVVWTPVGGGVYSRVTGFATDHVVADDARLFRFGSLPELQALTLSGTPPIPIQWAGGFYFDGTTLYVRFVDGTSPMSHAMHVARYQEGFRLNSASHVRIEGLELRHFGTSLYGAAIFLNGASNVVVRQNRIHGFEAAGVWMRGGDDNRIEDNEIWDTSVTSWPWQAVKGSVAENNGIIFESNATYSVGRGTVVRRNTVHGTFNGIGPCGDTNFYPPAGGVITNETDVYANLVTEITDDAFEIEGYCANVRVWGNTVRDAHMAFAVAPAAVGPVYILRNVAYRFGNTRSSLQDGQLSSALKINSGYSTPIGPLYLYHNTFLTDVTSTDAIALFQPGYSTFIRARNNVIAGTHYALWKVNTVTLDWDYDDLYTTDPARFVHWEGTAYPTLAALQAGTGQEPQGIAAAPGLVNPPGGDFRPGPGSPLVDRGLLIPGINDTYQGGAPDIGALESSGAATPTCSPSGSSSVLGDFDGDGRADVGIYRRTTGQWFIRCSADGSLLLVAWGAPTLGDVPVPADFDGDGRADIAVYRQATGEWFIRPSSINALVQIAWGAPSLGDVPVPGDYDGDGAADIAVYRATTGEWFIRPAATGSLVRVPWGAPSLGDVPVPADFDGDGRADIAVYRQATGEWYVRRSTDGTLLQVGWGAPSLGDVPVPADFDGDGRADIAVYRVFAGEWYIRRSTDAMLVQVGWGSPVLGDTPVQLDYDGDGRADMAVYRTSDGQWFIRRSTDAGLTQVGWGAPSLGDVPIMNP